jgi:hypothetical protein
MPKTLPNMLDKVILMSKMSSPIEFVLFYEGMVRDLDEDLYVCHLLKHHCWDADHKNSLYDQHMCVSVSFVFHNHIMQCAMCQYIFNCIHVPITTIGDDLRGQGFLITTWANLLLAYFYSL